MSSWSLYVHSLTLAACSNWSVHIHAQFGWLGLYLESQEVGCLFFARELTECLLYLFCLKSKLISCLLPLLSFMFCSTEDVFLLHSFTVYEWRFRSGLHCMVEKSSDEVDACVQFTLWQENPLFIIATETRGKAVGNFCEFCDKLCVNSLQHSCFHVIFVFVFSSPAPSPLTFFPHRTMQN